VLAAWGITETGHKVLLGLAPGTKEDTASCRDFLRDLKSCGLVCLAHKVRNLQSKVPEEVWREIKGAALAAYQAGSPKLAADGKGGLRAKYERDYSSGRRCAASRTSSPW
jgi:transposase-like protein